MSIERSGSNAGQWSKIGFNNSVDTYWLFHNSSQIAKSKVILYMSDDGSTPSNDLSNNTGEKYFVLVGRQYLGHQIPKGTDVYFRQVDGGRASYVNRELERFTNYDIATEHFDIDLDTFQEVDVPEGAFITVQNKSKNDVDVTFVNQRTGAFTLAEGQVLHHTFIKNGKIKITNRGLYGDITKKALVNVLIAQSQNVTKLSDDVTNMILSLINELDLIKQNMISRAELEIFISDALSGKWSKFLEVSGNKGIDNGAAPDSDGGKSHQWLFAYDKKKNIDKVLANGDVISVAINFTNEHSPIPTVTNENHMESNLFEFVLDSTSPTNRVLSESLSYEYSKLGHNIKHINIWHNVTTTGDKNYIMVEARIEGGTSPNVGACAVKSDRVIFDNDRYSTTQINNLGIVATGTRFVNKYLPNSYRNDLLTFVDNSSINEIFTNALRFYKALEAKGSNTVVADSCTAYSDASNIYKLTLKSGTNTIDIEYNDSTNTFKFKCPSPLIGNKIPLLFEFYTDSTEYGRGESILLNLSALVTRHSKTSVSNNTEVVYNIFASKYTAEDKVATVLKELKGLNKLHKTKIIVGDV